MGRCCRGIPDFNLYLPSSGAVILAYHHEQNIFKMGGLFYKNKFLFACFAIGGGALAAIPFI
ncbi:hypothetical protein EKL28_17880, partial [Staphylococcus aureus]